MTVEEKVKPLGNRLLVKRASAATSKGGILLPESATEKPKEGDVVAVGPGKMDEAGNLIALGVKKGDRVLFSSYAGTQVKSDEGEYLIMNEDDILAVIE